MRLGVLCPHGLRVHDGRAGEFVDVPRGKPVVSGCVDDRVSVRPRRHHRVVDHLGACDVHRGVVLVSVWTGHGHALLAIAVGALSFVDLLPAEAVHLVDDTPNDVIGVIGA